MTLKETLVGSLRALERFRRHEDVILTVLSILVGAVAGYGAVAFRWFVGVVQATFFGSNEEALYSIAQAAPWWLVLLAPVGGGLLVGLALRYAMPGRRAVAVADVMEAVDRREGKVPLVQGLWGAAISATTLGSGASAGREGPVVHLGACLASWIASTLRLSRTMGIYLLGCGVAAAIAASFNAPLAGALFAHEVVIRHYRLRAFAPIVIASVTGTLISRSEYGDFPAFSIPSYEIVSFWEFPAFALLGIVCAVAAIVLIQAIIRIGHEARRLPVPVWLHPAAGGLVVGAIAIAFPQILGVGYEATDLVLRGHFELWILVAVAAAKIVATGVTLGSGFGGGVFSPSLVIGAFIGAAFGIIAASAFPELASTRGAYTLVGMGAVASAVLGAPISTILIIFELTGDYAVTIAVMVAVVIANLIVTQLGPRSFFHAQLRDRGASMDEDVVTRQLRRTTVRSLMDERFSTVPGGMRLVNLRERLLNAPHGEVYVTGEGRAFVGTISLAEFFGKPRDEEEMNRVTAEQIARKEPPHLMAADTLEGAIELFSGIMDSHVPVLDNREDRQVIGVGHHRDVLVALERARQRAGETAEGVAER